jgi:hypothetical protein
MRRLLPIVLIALAVATAALAVNLLLVGYADERDDPVGNLNPRAALTEPTTTERRPSTANDTTTTANDDHGGDDDGGNSGHGGGDDDD